MHSFQAGFASRHDSASAALARVFGPPDDFAPIESIVRGPRPKPAAAAPKGFSPEPAGPKHFSPADAESNPTEGWDVFDSSPAQETNFVDPIAAAQAAGYIEGLDAGRAEAAAELARDQSLTGRLAEALTGASRIDRDRLAGHLRTTVLHLVTRLVGEIGVAPALLEARIESAIDLLADSAEAAVLRLHPEDMALVEGALPKSVFAAGDIGVQRGSFVLESATTVVEDGPELWIEQLTDAIEHAPLPPAC
ncbi:FliH/SctL family protein [Sphingomonas japonica]|uniref:Flagellar assembly protein FliH n=1 Tax=Sphingomonas japonica TaxID=511662 RepID=A0ABX0U378_9SPHN|nr:FliH/SctL family protein [Sphingomonas japonica]NIJ23831.1 flagellar assembly protein FliH [Sphingomonas japonica]